MKTRDEIAFGWGPRLSGPRGLFVRGLVVLAVLLAGPAAVADLDGAIETVLRGRATLGRATIAIDIVDVESGRTLFTSEEAYDGAGSARALIPASNLKLITTGAALMVLGPDFVFETTLALDGDRLIIIGSGDPGLADTRLMERAEPPMTADGMLTAFANAVTRREIESLSEIVVDDRVFDREWTHPTWPADQLNRWYCAEVGGVNFYTNCFTVYFNPDADSVGQPPTYSVAPIDPGASWISVSNRAKTIAKGRSTVWIARPRPANVFTLFGSARAGVSVPVDVTMHEPPLTAGRIIADRLARDGVTIGRSARASDGVRLAMDRENFENATPIAIVRTSIADVLRRSNVNSQNLYTEALIKRIGHEVTGEPGSWSNGTAVIRMLMTERLGPAHASTVRIADGSGMSRENGVPAQTMTAWLTHIAKDEALREPFIASMPTVGEGSLTRRFRTSRLENEVRAKTGSINGVRCLSGYVTSPKTGRMIAFSVLINDLDRGEPERRAREFHEKVVEAVDEWLADIEADLPMPALDGAGEPAMGG